MPLTVRVSFGGIVGSGGGMYCVGVGVVLGIFCDGRFETRMRIRTTRIVVNKAVRIKIFFMVLLYCNSAIVES